MQRKHHLEVRLNHDLKKKKKKKKKKMMMKKRKEYSLMGLNWK